MAAMLTSIILDLVRKSRTDIAAFMVLTEKLGDIPTENLVDFIDVCHYHLKKPVESTLSKDVYDGAVWIAASFTGLSGITSDLVLKEGVTLRQRIVECWPDIIRWGKAMVEKNPIPQLFGTFCDSAGTIFSLTLALSLPLPKSQDAYDVAIDLWKGREIAGVDYYSDLPLLVCASAQGGQEVARLIERTGYDSKQVVDKTVNRLKRAVATSPINHQKISASASLLSCLVEARPHSISTVTLCSEASTVMASNLARLVNEKKDSSLRKATVAALLNFLKSFIQDGPHRVAEIAEGDFLRGLLESASKQLDWFEDDISSPCIRESLSSLVYRDTLRSLSYGFDNLLTGGHKLSKLLKDARASFRLEWEIFQELLVEGLLLSSLLERGYARERGACANQVCRKLADRREYKKCAGCGFALYCSEDCQTKDWSSHRVDCKKIESEDVVHFTDPFYQFPRKVAIAQINRYWPEISALAGKNSIPEKTLGIRVDYSDYPFKIGVFDYRPLASKDANKQNEPGVTKSSTPDWSISYHPMVAKEALRRSQDGHRYVMLIIVQFNELEIPSLAYLDSPPSPLSALQVKNSRARMFESHYTDELGNRLNPRDDALGEALTEALTRLRKDGDTFWRNNLKEFNDIVDEVLDR